VGFFCGRPCDLELVTGQSERSGNQQRLLQAFTEDVFVFSLLVYTAHYSFLDNALYKFTYLLTYLLTYTVGTFTPGLETELSALTYITYT